MFVLICTKSFAQIDFRVNQLIISNFQVDYSSCEIDEDWEDGPYLSFGCKLMNNSKDTLFINPFTCKFYLQFTYNDKKYIDELISRNWDYERASLLIAEGEYITFNLGSNIFLGTDILIEKKENYSLELIKILPTIKLFFVDTTSKIKVSLSSIDNVKTVNPKFQE